jgi:serine protease Do
MQFIANKCIDRNKIFLLLGIFCLSTLFGFFAMNPAWAQDTPRSFAKLAEAVAHPVVNIYTTQTVERRAMPGFPPEGPMEDFFGRFFEGMPPAPRQAQALGSGFLIDREGHIFTNYHVIAKATEIRVRLQTGKEYDAEVIGRDPKTDLALIRIQNPDELPTPAQLGDSEDLQVGDWVLAVGNPFGLGHSVTAGIIGAKSRVIGAGPYDDFLQTDAAINPGNSGGPLFNVDGKVVGINTAIVAQGQGIGFAIPINMAKELLPQLKAGRIIRGYLGVGIQSITPELAQTFGLESDEGVIVTNIMEGTPAAESELQEGDIVVSVNGQPVKTAHDLSARVAAMSPGNEATMKVLRDGRDQTITVKVGQMPEPDLAQQDDPSSERPQWGLAIQDIPPEIARRYDLGSTQGVIVSQVVPGSPAAIAGLQRGDIIRAVGKEKIESAEQFMQIIQKAGDEKRLAFKVQRGENHFYAVLEALENQDR